MIREFASRLWGTLRGKRADQDLKQELALHLEAVEDELRRQGHSPREAARLARIQAGGETQVMETLRDQRGLPGLGAFWLDIKLGLRMLRKHWGLTLAGGLALTVAMTLGASVFDLLRVLTRTTLPLDEGDRVVVIQTWDAASQESRPSSMENFARWRDGLRSVTGTGAYRTVGRNLITEAGSAAPVSIAEMSAAGFQVARVAPLMGRFLADEDESMAAPPVVVIGFNAWRSRFAADPQVVGKRVQLDGTFHSIVGVMPAGFGFPINHQFWAPLRAKAEGKVTVFARLASGVTLQAANAEVEGIGLDSSTETAAANPPPQPRVVSYITGVMDNLSGWELVLVQLAPLLLSLLLVPPCANISILIYARTVSRQSEFAVRTSLGASRRRIVGQLYIEALLLAVGAAGLALVLAPNLVDFLRINVMPGGTPFWMEFRLSYQTILFAAGLAMIAAMLAGGLPALRVTGRRKQAGLHSLGGRSAPQLGKTWTALVVLQVALSVAILPLATKVAWTMARPVIVGPGFAATEFFTARLGMDERAAPDARAARFAAAREGVIQRLKAERGVTAVTAVWSLPSEESIVPIEIEGAGLKSVKFNRVDREFVQVFGFRVLTGRGFEAGDFEPGRSAILVNRSLARQLLGDGNPLGRRIRIDKVTFGKETAPWHQVVGVVDDFSEQTGTHKIYAPLPERGQDAQFGSLYTYIALHAGPATANELPARLKEIATGLDPALRVDRLRTMDAVYWAEYRELYVAAWALAGLVLGIVLFSAAGVYTLMSFTVVQRRQEIGIRSALGAPPWRLVMGTFWRLLVPVSAGAGLGGLTALLLNNWFGVLFDLRDGGLVLPWVLPAAEASMVGIGIVALLGPIRRALRVDPVEAMRNG